MFHYRVHSGSWLDKTQIVITDLRAESATKREKAENIDLIYCLDHKVKLNIMKLNMSHKNKFES